MNFGHNWDNVKIEKSESHAYRRRFTNSFFDKPKVLFLPKASNPNDSANFSTVYSVFNVNKLCLVYVITPCT